MSGPSRELPPLRIRITGDNSSAVKAIQGTVKAAQDANKEIAKGYKQTTKAVAIQRKAEEERAKQVAESRKAIAKQTKQLQTEEQEAVSRGRRRHKHRLLEQRKSFEEDINNRLSHHNHVQRTIANMRALREKADRDEENFNRQRRQRTERARQQRQRAREREVRDLRNHFRQVSGAMSGGSMMGARADIYMHRDSLKSMTANILSLVRPFAMVEDYTIQMQVFSGSAEKAQEAVKELQEYAIASPYTLDGVLEAANTMQKYGANTQHAIEMTKLLGDVAAGNTHRLELMALGVAQAEALGRFQGQELRQMVNAGFNPLTVAAQEMAGPGASDEAIKKQMQILQSAMRRGELDSGIIRAALEVATSKGGNYAGMTDMQAKTLTGLANQILETLDLAAIEIVKTFAGDLKDLMKIVKQYVDAAILWMQANGEVVKSYVMLGLQIAKYVATFSAMAMAVAYLKWIVGSVITVFGAFWSLLVPLRLMLVILTANRAALMGLIKSVTALRLATALFGATAVTSWLAAAGPIALIIALVLALGFVVSGLLHKDGFTGVVQDWASWLGWFAGFFWNFGHNITQIFAWIGANWRLMLVDMALSTMKPLMDIAQIVAKVFGKDQMVRDAREGFRDMMVGQLGGDTSAYDTSMFKTDLPSMEGMLGGYLGGQLDFLKPFMKEDPEKTLKDKPNIDFNKFVGGSGGDGGFAAKMAPDHALRGSSDHAVRMWEYGEKASAESMAAKQSHEKTTEDLLTKIERNTRSGMGMSGDPIEEAMLV
jgi:hypothetical protein